MIAQRKKNDWVVYGDYELLETSDNVFAYLRHFEGKQYLVVVNFSDEVASFDSQFVGGKGIIANRQIPKDLTHVALQPWDAFAIEVASE